MRQDHLSRRAAAGLLALLITAGSAATPALAQANPSDVLTRNLTLLDSDPRNLEALIAAGDAALAIGDLPSAAGLYSRADEVNGPDPRPDIGLGAVAAAMNDPRRAMTYFEIARGQGASALQMGADRGLAYDLLGQSAQAEQDYRAAIGGPRADAARRRLALNLAAKGDRTAAMALLNPLVSAGDPEGLRARAFVLALTGDVDNARRAIDSAMPGSGAQIEPFLRRLSSLDSAQQAAAVHLGIFPTGNQVASAQPATPRLGVPAARQPASPVVRPSAPAPRPQAERQAARPPAPQPRVEPRAEPREEREPSRSLVANRPAQSGYIYRPTPRGPVAYPIADTVEEPETSDEPRAATQAAPTPPPAPRPVVASAAPQRVVERTELPPSEAARREDEDRLAAIDDVLRDAPEAAAQSAPPPPRPRYEAPPPPRPRVESATPSIAPAQEAAPDIGVEGSWFVQLAGSSDRSAMDFEWRRLRGRAPGLLSDRQPLLTRGASFHRLLVGPFSGRGEAQALVNQLKAAGVDAFAWSRSPAQLRIDEL